MEHCVSTWYITSNLAWYYADLTKSWDTCALHLYISTGASSQIIYFTKNKEAFEYKIHTTFISLAKMYNSAALAGSLESHILQALTKKTKLIKKVYLKLFSKGKVLFLERNGQDH